MVSETFFSPILCVFVHIGAIHENLMNFTLYIPICSYLFNFVQIFFKFIHYYSDLFEYPTKFVKDLTISSDFI